MNPKAPTVPPKDIGNDIKSQHEFLMSMLSNPEKTYYPSMDPLSQVAF